MDHAAEARPDCCVHLNHMPTEYLKRLYFDTIVFTPDVLPTVNHVGAAYNMAYDVEPYISTVTRHWFLEAAVEQDWLLVLDHEPGNPLNQT